MSRDFMVYGSNRPSVSLSAISFRYKGIGTSSIRSTVVTPLVRLIAGGQEGGTPTLTVSTPIFEVEDGGSVTDNSNVAGTVTEVQPLLRKKAPFVWPKTVDEFIAFDPKYIVKWLHSRKCVPTLINDFAQDLYLHLCTPNRECIEKGYKDRMALYDPIKLGGATTLAAWAYWLSGILTNQYGKLIKAQKRGHTEGPNVISMDDVNVETGQESWWSQTEQHEHTRFMATVGEVYNGVTSRILLEDVIRVVQEEIGDEAVEVLSAVIESNDAVEAAELMGVSPERIRRTTRNIIRVAQAVLGISASNLMKIMAA